MYDSNVRGTERVLDAAIDAGITRVVYASTVNVFGNTRGQVVDEDYERPDREFMSYYDETKFLSHEVALDRLRRGAPIVIVQPAGVYGPDDHSEIGNMIEQTRSGKLKAKMFPETGLCLVHVEDVAAGVLLAHDHGEVGQSYVLAGERTTMGEIVDKVAEIAGRKPPAMTLPTGMIKLGAPFGPVLGPLMGFPPNMRELITVSDGVTMWASDEKARRELGFKPRSLDTGLRETLAAAA
jgi:dihydroflavonol-4-reductase